MLEQIFVISFIVLAIHATMQHGMIFSFVQNWCAKLPDWSKKIIYGCPCCSTPYYGSAAYLIVYGNSWKEFIVVIIGSMGVNYLISFFLPND